MPNVLPNESDKNVEILLNLTNKAIPTMFMLNDDTQFDFDDVLSIEFPLFTQGFVDLNNIPTTEKVLLSLNINYRWIGAELAPRYELSIYKNNEVVYTVLRGVSDSSETMNKLEEKIIIDIQEGDKIRIEISKYIQDTNDLILLLKNSFYSYIVLN